MTAGIASCGKSGRAASERRCGCCGTFTLSPGVPSEGRRRGVNEAEAKRLPGALQTAQRRAASRAAVPRARMPRPTGPAVPTAPFALHRTFPPTCEAWCSEAMTGGKRSSAGAGGAVTASRYRRGSQLTFVARLCFNEISVRIPTHTWVTVVIGYLCSF